MGVTGGGYCTKAASGLLLSMGKVDQMTDDDYTPLIDREREPKSRIYQDLTEPARERLSVITRNKGVKARGNAIDYLIKRVGKSPLKNYWLNSPFQEGKNVLHNKFLMNGETLHILTYIEIIVRKHHLNEIMKKVSDESGELSNELEAYPPTQNTDRTIEDIRNVLITEGILWDIQRLGEGGVIEFVPLESDGLKRVDEDLQEIAEEKPWGSALRGYNSAVDNYLGGKFDEQIPKKLYYSIEEVLKIICVDKENWTDNRELTHSEYLDLLKEEGVYDAHGVTATELGDLLDSLERMVAKVSDDRKQRHAYHDRTYATLLIHQVGSYLYFLINRYRQYSNRSQG